MEQDFSLTQNVDTLFTNLENFTQNQGLIGKAVVQGDKTFIPVVSVTLGYGGGNSASKLQQGTQNASSGTGNMAGGALGLGAKLSTEAIILIENEKVSMMQVGSTTNMNQLMDKVPQILSGINPIGQQGQQGQQKGQQQGMQ